MEKVFVYGTLRKGGHYHHLLEDSTFLINGFVPGEMYSLGAYPAVVISDDCSLKVYGEVFSVTEDVLSKLDKLEGHPEFYLRIMQKIEIENGRPVNAWIYVISEDEIKGDLKKVDSGDWFEFINNNAGG